jgi:phosphopantetheine--protein transferase-like protein
MISSPFPNDIGFAAIDIPQVSLSSKYLLEDEIALANEISNLEIKKQFLAGRIAAKMALNQIDFLEAFAINRNTDRSPKWPEGITGSISHTDNIAVACVCRKSDYRALGIDIEKVDRVFDKSIASKILTNNESLLIKNNQWQEVYILSVFSIKECIYKALSSIGLQNLRYQEFDVILPSINKQEEAKHQVIVKVLHFETQKLLNINTLEISLSTSKEFILSSLAIR